MGRDPKSGQGAPLPVRLCEGGPGQEERSPKTMVFGVPRKSAGVHLTVPEERKKGEMPKSSPNPGSHHGDYASEEHVVDGTRSQTAPVSRNHPFVFGGLALAKAPGACHTRYRGAKPLLGAPFVPEPLAVAVVLLVCVAVVAV